MIRAHAALPICILVTLSACADSRTVTAPDAIRPSLEVEGIGDAPIRHVLDIRTRAAAVHAANAAWARRGGGTGIYYHGGPLLTPPLNTSVASIYWAAVPIYAGGPTPGSVGNGASDGSVVGFFLRHLGGSPYFNINTTYYNSSNVHVANAVSYTQFWANNVNAPTNGQNVSDAQMLAMLQQGFNSGTLSYDAHTLYAIFTAGTVNLGGGFGTQYCAYHSSGTVTINGTSQRVLYAAMPYDDAYPSACTNGTASPNGDPGADAEVNTLGHETEETTTDYLGNAWYDLRGYENADKCAWNFGATYRTSNGGVANMQLGNAEDGFRDFLVQQNWVNAGSGGCALKY